MVKVITFGNFKGGTGKSTNSCMIAYQLAKQGYKVLLADLDPQANSTSLFLKTKQVQNNEVVKFDNTLMNAISNDDISTIVTKIRDNLYLLPSFADFTSYPIFLEKKYPNPDEQYKRAKHFSTLLDKIKDEYDYIIIDTPPTVSVYTDSALMASDGVIIVLQTQERSYVGAEAFISYLQELVSNYDANFTIAGILPVLLKNNSQVDQSILEQAEDEFDKDNLFTNVVKNMERLKRYDIIGIVDPDLETQKHDMHDKRVNHLYQNITKEFVERVGK
ncbi:AAA family ATPase [Levilactobacillus brevis]|uniref:ParA family protein n=1 Tax=Levilactobacillus brevis TaxID=1580 RepID=UPI001F2F13BE|nr:AAA family ATPase [Levilactobacillus brevis]MCE6013869.1 AAA family ATPase [Levilactobacillus brevis]MCE6016218.1 AAA family ATPase [Levilactobacillus brevis]MCE6018632.1 AAA family ATPase [Levilactobacillus brevis]